jgi:DNA polymerase I-like protein with 3'-5' exonuclease and polymerase domains
MTKFPKSPYIHDFRSREDQTHVLLFIESRQGNAHINGSGLNDSNEIMHKRDSYIIKEIYRNITKKCATATQLNEALGLIVLSPPTDLFSKNTDGFIDMLLKMINNLSEKYERVSVVSCLDQLTSYLYLEHVNKNKIAKSNPYNYLNVLLPNKSSPTKLKFKLPFDLPENVGFSVSVPSSIFALPYFGSKDSGPAMMGFVYRAALAGLVGHNEGSIYSKLSQYNKVSKGEEKSPRQKVTIIKTIKQFDKFYSVLTQSKFVSIDTETRSLARINSDILTVQFACVGLDVFNQYKSNLHKIPVNLIKVYTLPVTHPDTPWDGRDLKYIKSKLKTYLENKQKQSVTHIYVNAKFDLHQLKNLTDFDFYQHNIYDIQAGEFSLEENGRLTSLLNIAYYSLEAIENRYGYDRPEDLIIAKSDRSNMSQFSIDEISDYGCIDVVSPLYLCFEQIRIAKDRDYPNFALFITQQMGKMLLVMTVMEHNGIPIDMDYLKSISSPHGSLQTMILESANEIYATEKALKLNKKYLEADGIQTDSEGYVSSFAGKQRVQRFSLQKQEHLQDFFFGQLKLKPVNIRKDGGGSLNKAFQKMHRHVLEVAKYSNYQKLIKLKSAFATAIYDYMIKESDNSDGRLRPQFHYRTVLTGRSSSSSPSSQQIPTHGKQAKIIKRQFCARPGYVLNKNDMSGHEVRTSGNLGLDGALTGAVDSVNKVWYEYRTGSTDFAKKLEESGELERRGDLHIANAKVFFDVDIDKKSELRQLAKASVFAVTYGSKERSMGITMLEQARTALEDKVRELKAKINELSDKERLQLQRDEQQVAYLYSEEAEEEYIQKAKDLLKTLFDKWSVLAEYIENLQKTAKKENVIFGPHGRPRHLWGYFHPDKFVRFAMDRRAFNSISQGFASDIGYIGMYLFYEAMWLFKSKGFDMKTKQCSAVHDSQLNDCPYVVLPLVLYLTEHCMVGLNAQYYKNKFDIWPQTMYSCDLEVGPDESDMETYNKRPRDLEAFCRKIGIKCNIHPDIVEKVAADARTIGKLRLSELRETTNLSDENKPDVCQLLTNSETFDRIVPSLNMWKSLHRYYEEDGTFKTKYLHHYEKENK